MTPNFSLSLSFEGIRLLQRADDGWLLVGEVALDVPDLTGALADLRAQAMGLDPSGLRTKLLIPNDQIKYDAIDTTRTELDDIHAALDGATPYAIADLAIDFDRTGGRTHIAAVANETLAEAEAFAVEHKFAPICFAAVPDPFTFRSEVFFGMTAFAKSILPPGEDVTRDDKPVLVVGQIETTPKPKPEPEPDPTPVEAIPPAQDQNEKDEVVAEEIVFASRARGPNADTVVTPIDPPEIEPLFTRRKEPLIIDPIDAAPVAPAAPVVVAPVAPARAKTEKTSQTVFDKPKAAANVGGKPRYLGVILFVLLLLFLAVIAMWANTLSPSGIAGWFRSAPQDTPVVTVVADPIAATPIDDTATVLAPIEETAAPLPVPTSPAGTLPIVRELTGRVLSPSEADRTYAATGVYQRAPRMPAPPRQLTLDGFQKAVALPDTQKLAALSLPDMALMFPDQALGTQLDPPPPGTTFPRDVRGFILATPDGTVTPDGVIVFAARPVKEPPLRPGTEIPEATAVVPEPLSGDPGLRLVAGRPPFEPPLRPEGLAPVVEAIVAPDATAPVVEGLNLVNGRPSRTPPLRPASFADRAVVEDTLAPAADVPIIEIAAVVVNPVGATGFGGVTLRSIKPTLRAAGFVAPEVVAFASDPALARFRPSLRPADLAPPVVAEDDTPDPANDVTSLIAGLAAATPDNPIVTPTRRAIVASPRPDTRPRNIATLVANATARLARQPTATAATTAVSSTPAVSNGPVPSSVAQAATIDNAIRLRDLNLIGVYGRSNDRRALVRLSNGRYVKVEVGSRLDGGQVTAIGDSALNYVKSGRTYALELPAG